MKELFRKYLDNKCTPAEVKELLGYFNLPENELLLRKLIMESLEDDADYGSIQWDNISDQTFTRIKEDMHKGKVKEIPFFRQTWFRVAAAAILVIAGFALYHSITNQKSVNQETVSTNVTPSEILPGGNKAVLILADGSSIVLDSAADGIVSQQGNIQIVKEKNGQLAYNTLKEKPTEVLFNSIETPRGGQYQLTLSDGSKIWLNAESSVRFPVVFTDNKRRIEITGEAYLEVAKNPSQPFIVNVANKGEVEVLGTHFNINSYADEATINTTLLEGSVKVTALSSKGSIIISPGQQAQVNKNGSINLNKKADIEQTIAWKNGVFNFNNSDLETVLHQLSRWYDVDISFEGPVPQRQFTGEMPRDMKLSEVLKLLENNSVYCRIEGKKLVVLK